MSESPYPILIERFRGQRSMTIVCERCHEEAVLDPDELLNDGTYECPADTERRRRRASTEPRCRGTAVMKYDEGDKCKSCGKLGYWEPALDGCCSWACMLQAEYAESLEASRG